jgi:cytochrome c1
MTGQVLRQTLKSKLKDWRRENMPGQSSLTSQYYGAITEYLLATVTRKTPW